MLPFRNQVAVGDIFSTTGGTASASATAFGGIGDDYSVGGGARATASATTTDGGIANATANANGGAANPVTMGGPASATATSTAMLGGTANAIATAIAGSSKFNGAPDLIFGAANANSFATTINGNTALAQSTALGSSEQAQATAQSNFGSFNSVQTMATSQVESIRGAPSLGPSATTTTAIVQASGPAPSNALSPGQSFSVVSAIASGPLAFALGSMGAAYGGVDDVQFTYQESADFIFNSIGGPFVIGLLDASSLGSGFQNATFQTFDNGNLVNSRSFSDLISAEAFFSNNLLDIQLRAGLNDIQLLFSETVGRGQGFSFNYAVAGAAPGTTPLPATLPLFATGLGVMGLLGWRRKRRGVAAIAGT